MTRQDGNDGCRVGVVGAGSVGLLFAARLGAAFSHLPAKQGAVTVVTRREDVRPLVEAGGIRVARPASAAPEDGNSWLAPDRISIVRPEDDLAAAACDLVIVACRSEESAYALTTAERLAAGAGTILVIQNGLRAWQLARRDGVRCICGATYEIAHPLAPNAVRWTRVGRTEIATPSASRGREADTARIVRIFEAASMSLVPGRSEADIVWRKLALTIPNWVAAAVGTPLHAVVEAPGADRLLLDLAGELAGIAEADGVELPVEWAAAEFAALRGSESVGSAYTALARGQDLEVVDICLSLASIQQRVFAARAGETAAVTA